MFAVNNYLVINQSKSVFKNIKFYVVGKNGFTFVGGGGSLRKIEYFVELL